MIERYDFHFMPIGIGNSLKSNSKKRTKIIVILVADPDNKFVLLQQSVFTIKSIFLFVLLLP